MRYSGVILVSCCLCLFAGALRAGQEETAEQTLAEPAAEQAPAEPAAEQTPAERTSAEPSAEQPAATPPQAGSQLAADANRCAMCHTEPALWDEAHQKLFIQPEKLGDDVHWKRGVNCHDCHAGDPATTNYAEAHVGLVPVDQLRQRCALCHEQQRLGLLKSVHAKAGEKDERGRGLPLDCGKCHGASPHAILPVKDPKSPMFLNNQVETCGACHEEHQKTYEETVHGKGLNESGLLVTAVCADCHGAHGIYYAADRRSTLNVSNVASTCSKCHQFIEKRLANSVHGGDLGLGAATEHPAAGGKIKRHPTCTDCHQGHHLLRSDAAQFRLELTNRCGNCHADLSSRYALSMHGELTQQGYAAAADCADCHGAHDILPVADPNSGLAPGKDRLQTCQKCHAYAVNNFTQYDPHADYKDATRYPKFHALYSGIQFTVNVCFLFFLFHAVLWFVRAMVDRLQHGRHTTLGSDQYALTRSRPSDRVTYAVLIVAFFGLTATGLALRHSDQEWGQWLGGVLGGFRSASVWHHFFAVVAIVAGLSQVGRAVTRITDLRPGRTWKNILFGPDSRVPNGRDLRDLGKMFLWFIGFGRKPGFERWTYWEKLDYWALGLASVLIGISGLMIWYPNLFCVVLPGTVLNVAKMVHSEYAIYTASFLFLIHYFHAHFRPEKFPMDLSVLTGMVSERHLREYRPEYVARLEKEGKLSEMRQPAPSKRNVWLNVVGGVVVFTLGFCLLAIVVLASLGE